MILSFDFAENATIEIIAAARINAAIVPNSGTTLENFTTSPAGPVNGFSIP